MRTITESGYEIGAARDVLATLEPKQFHTCVTSPPYWGLRDYGVTGQIGLEATIDEYVEKIVAVFREVRRVLRDDGTAWIVIGDSYIGNFPGGRDPNRWPKQNSNSVVHGFSKKLQNVLKNKDIAGIPWRVAFGLQADGWYLRQDIIWNKPNPMPESVKDRCTKSHEYIFLLSKSRSYYCDMESIREPDNGSASGNGFAGRQGNERAAATQGGVGSNARFEPGAGRNKRDVWIVPTKPFTGAHFATFPPELIKPCILAGSPLGGLVLDPFLGSGTTARVATDLGRRWFGVELNPEYSELIDKRTAQLGILERLGGEGS